MAGVMPAISYKWYSGLLFHQLFYCCFAIAGDVCEVYAGRKCAYIYSRRSVAKRLLQHELAGEGEYFYRCIFCYW